MTARAPTNAAPPRRDRAVVPVVRSWRLLTSGVTPSGRAGKGEPTLVAVSAGADSSALLLALAAATDRLVVAHVIHDLRPAAQSEADCDATRALAARLSLPFVESRVSLRDLTIDGEPAPASIVRRRADHNPEGLARRLRYLALSRLAHERNLRFVATGHHASDQLESILMGLVRGSGPHGLRGVAPAVALPNPYAPVTIIRPMLDLSHTDCEALCTRCAWVWRDDHTNSDTTRLRAALREHVAPPLRAIRPRADHHAADAAALLRDASDLVADHVAPLLAAALHAAPQPLTELSFPRTALRAERAIVVGELLRGSARLLLAGAGLDRLGQAQLEPIIAAIRDPSPSPRGFSPRGLSVDVRSRTVTISKTASDPAPRPV